MTPQAEIAELRFRVGQLEAVLRDLPQTCAHGEDGCDALKAARRALKEALDADLQRCRRHLDLAWYDINAAIPGAAERYNHWAVELIRLLEERRRA